MAQHMDQPQHQERRTCRNKRLFGRLRCSPE